MWAHLTWPIFFIYWVIYLRYYDYLWVYLPWPCLTHTPNPFIWPKPISHIPEYPFLAHKGMRTPPTPQFPNTSPLLSLLPNASPLLSLLLNLLFHPPWSLVCSMVIIHKKSSLFLEGAPFPSFSLLFLFHYHVICRCFSNVDDLIFMSSHLFCWF